MEHCTEKKELPKRAFEIHGLFAEALAQEQLQENRPKPPEKPPEGGGCSW